MRNIIVSLITMICTTSLMAQNLDESEIRNIAAQQGVSITFPITTKVPTSTNTGDVYVGMNKNSGNNMVFSFLFTKGARNSWHIHPDAEQTLMILDGEAYYQEEGQPKQLLKKGDVIVTKPNVKHWNGATENNACVCMTISEKNDKEHAIQYNKVTDSEFLSRD